MQPARLIAIGLSCLAAVATSLASEQRSAAEQWFYSDDEERALAVNEGELTFIPVPPKSPVLHTTSRLVIDSQTLDSGWLQLQQCYHHLDPVAATAVRYDYRDMQALQVTERRNIGSASVQGQSVELTDIKSDASLCIQARVKLLEQREGRYILRSGPYHRRFLDGYYPFHVSLELHYPADRLKLESISPGPQPGFAVNSRNDRLTIDSWFQGRLIIEVFFSELKD